MIGIDSEIVTRLSLRLNDEDLYTLSDIASSAEQIILSRRYPYGDFPSALPARYTDLCFRIAMDMYNRLGAEGQLSHNENSISRSWGAEWVSEQLLHEIVPLVGVV